jgi:hypothetical protein
MRIASQMLAVYSWAGVAALVLLLWRIALYYQRASGEGVGHWILAIPALLLGAGAIRYILAGAKFCGDPASDLLLFAGGLVLIGFGFNLQEHMTGARK